MQIDLDYKLRPEVGADVNNKNPHLSHCNAMGLYVVTLSYLRVHQSTLTTHVPNLHFLVCQIYQNVCRLSVKRETKAMKIYPMRPCQSIPGGEGVVGPTSDDRRRSDVISGGGIGDQFSPTDVDMVRRGGGVRRPTSADRRAGFQKRILCEKLRDNLRTVNQQLT